MCRFLMIDDNEELCKFLQSELQKNNEVLRIEPEYTIKADEARRLAKEAVEEGNPYDVFLIDLILEDSDGIELMSELKNTSPETDAIIITNQFNSENGLRAYEYGAKHYLGKPVNIKELIVILKILKHHRKITTQRDWMQTLIQIYQDNEHSTEFKKVTEIILKDCLKLGFQRAFLLWKPYSLEDGCMLGICHQGNPKAASFKDHKFSIVDSPYLSIANTDSLQTAFFFNGREHGKDILEKEFDQTEYQIPKGEWVLMPIRVDENFVGAVILDFASQKTKLSTAQRELFSLLSHQITSMLERARLAGLERRNTKFIRITNAIGRYINDRAAYLSLDALLNEIRDKTQELMSVDNFVIFLLDENSQQLDFRLHYNQDKSLARHFTPKDEGLPGMVISESEILYLNEEDDLLQDGETIKLYGKPPKCWGGVPLRIENKSIGAIMIHNYENCRAFTKDDLALLQKIADQVAGAILMSQQVEREREDKKRLFILERASAELVKLAHESEESLWFVLLTLVTAEFGLCFNRAWLYLCDANCLNLQGVMGIGHFTKKQAEADWDKDSEVKKDFNRFLMDFHQGLIKHTPIEEITKKMLIPLENDQTRLRNFLLDPKEREYFLSLKDITGWLPDEFTAQFSPEHSAILALKSGSTPFGLLVVDNKHNGCVIPHELLEQLEALMNIGITACEYARRENQVENLLQLTDSVVHQSAGPQLKSILTRICETARQITGADYVVIFPLKSDGANEYDTDSNAQAGKLVKPRKISDKPRKRGMSSFILNSERLAIDDVENCELKIDGIMITEHKFVVQEGIKAFIAIPIRDPKSGVSLGVMYFDYRTPQDFDNEETINKAQAISALAGFAIQNAQRDRRGQSNERELTILKRIFEQSMEPNLTYNNLFWSLRGCFIDLLRDPTLEVDLYRQHWERDIDKDQPRLAFKRYSKQTFEDAKAPDILSVGDEYRHILSASKAISSQWYEDTREVIVPLMVGRRHIGVIRIVGFSNRPSDWALPSMKRLADATAPAFENLTRQKQMENILKAVKSITCPDDLGTTFEAILKAIRYVIPRASSAVVWYTNPFDRKKQILGDWYGVRDVDGMKRSIKRPDSKVLTIMNHKEQSIWEPDMSEQSPLWGGFVKHEGVKAAVAFRLQVENENVGALFINYPEPYEFTEEDKYILPLLAEICAVNIHDAIRLSGIQQERDRLENTLATAEAIGTTFNIEEISQKVLGRLKSSYPEYQICLLYYDDDNQEFRFSLPVGNYYKVNNAAYQLKRALTLNDKAISTDAAKQALKDKKTCLINTGHVKSHPNYLDMIVETQSQLTVAVVGTTEQLLCVLVVERKESGEFEPIEEKFFNGVAQHLGTAIERSKQAEDLNFKEIVSSITASAGELAHDINREVGRIRNHADWIIRELGNNEKVHEYAKEIDDCAERISEAGTWSSPQNKKATIDKELPILLNSLLQPYPEVQAEYLLNCSDVIININLTILSRILRHLVRNASHAMKKKGKIIMRSHIPEDNKNIVEIQFEDTGPGINEAMRPYIFKQPVVSKNSEGGYGLLITRQLVESLGGRISLLNTDEGKGAIFSIHLPIFCEERNRR